MCQLGIISYDFPHLKSEQVFHNLMEKGYDLKIFLLPFLARKRRTNLMNHRPDQTKSINLGILGKKYKIPVKICKEDIEIEDDCDYYLILGSNLLSEDCVKNKKIINCHSGIIPSSRGLDSFKFSILNKIKLGVSLHFIDKNIDEGKLISTIETPVYRGDSFETLSRRHYENEIKVLSNFEKYLNSPVFVKGQFIRNKPTMRMKMDQEKRMLKEFDDYIELYSL